MVGVAKVADRWRAYGALFRMDRTAALAKLRRVDFRALRGGLRTPASGFSQPRRPSSSLLASSSPHIRPCRDRIPSLAALEERLAQYQRLGEDAWAAGADCDVHFVRVR